MKLPCLDIGAGALLGIALALGACSVDRAIDAHGIAAAEPAAPDLPAAMSLMQPQAIYANLVELRHYSAYNAFHAIQGTSGSSGSAGAPGQGAACFGNQ
jgi:hypothetical protein